MALRTERRDGSPERRVLIGMVMTRRVLGPIAEKWHAGVGLFASKWGNLIAGWCVSHYRKYHRAPGPSITHYFEAWAEAAQDRETIDAVESFLAGLSDEAERIRDSISPDHLLDMAKDLFEKVHLNDLMGRVAAHIERGEVERAREVVDRSRKIEIGTGAGVNVLTAEEAVAAAFEKRSEAIVEYPGAAGNFFRGVCDGGYGGGAALCRDAFISFMAPEKRGKSFWLGDLAFRAVEQDRNVAYFEVGDMSQDQVIRRIAARASCRPINHCRYEYPLSIESQGGRNLPNIETDYRTEVHGLSSDEAIEELRRIGEKRGQSRFKLSCHPNSSISVSGIEGILEGWSRDDWRPDVVVIDYADILAGLNSREEPRDQINSTWKALRGLSQRHHCLVVTATQADSASYDQWILSRKNFSEDKRKYAHVTGMVGINQVSAEKDKGVFRLNWIMLRELDFSESKCLWTASCLAVANPCVVSTF